MFRFDLDAIQWLLRILWLAFLAIFLVCVGMFIRQYAAGALPGLAPATVAPITVTQSALPAESHLRVAVAPPLDRRYPGQSGPLVLLIENDGDADAVFSASALVEGECIHLDTAMAEPTNAVSVDKNGTASLTVHAHQAISLRIPVRTACPHAHLPLSEPVELAFTWKFPAAKPASTFAGLIATAPLTVTSANAEFYRRAAAIVDLLAKDFTWPVLLAVLGFLAQLKLAHRADRQQVFNTLLPSYTALVQSHYLPITRRMQIVAIEAENIKPGKTADIELALQRTFCAVLMMRGRMLFLFREKGGVLFRTNVGEELFATCIGVFYRDRFQPATGNPGQCETLAASLDAEFTLQQAIEFLFDWQRKYITQPLFAGFSAAAADAATGAKNAEFDGALELLSLASEVMTFECDRIYYQTESYGDAGEAKWYFDPPQFEYKGDLSKITPDTLRNQIRALYRTYLDGMPRKCRKNVAYPR